LSFLQKRPDFLDPISRVRRFHLSPSKFDSGEAVAFSDSPLPFEFHYQYLHCMPLFMAELVYKLHVLLVGGWSYNKNICELQFVSRRKFFVKCYVSR
jgi:hypothetical protein